jgi:two-component system phosphate regulon response regulator PhoB
MSDSLTVILAAKRLDLLAAVAHAMPDARAMVVGRKPYFRRLSGPIICFVDWLLPEISGLEMCRRLREYPATAHSLIILILEENDADSRRRAVKAGADDYLAGPLTPDLLVTLIREYAGRAHARHSPTLVHGQLTVDLVAHRVFWCKRPIELTPTPFLLLTHFIEHPNQVFTRRSLIALLNKEEHEIDERTVDVWIGRLRRELKKHGAPDPLRTIRSVGYALNKLS